MSTTNETILTTSEDDLPTISIHLERTKDWKIEVYRVEDEPGVHICVETFDVFDLETMTKFGAAVLGANVIAGTVEEKIR